MGNSTTSFFIAFFAIAALSTTCSTVVTYLILKPLSSVSDFRNLSASSRLVFYLHATLLIQDIASLPIIYNPVRDLCITMAFFHIFTGSCNALIMGLQGLLYRYYLLTDKFKVTEWINKYCEYVVFIPPLISFLPLSTGAYDEDDEPYCTMSTTVWNFTVLYGLVWAILLPSLALVVHTIVTVYRSFPEMGSSLFSRLGFYYLITLVSWVPRTAFRIAQSAGAISAMDYYAVFHLSTYIAGILYFFVFVSEMESLRMFEQFFNFNPEEGVEFSPSIVFGDQSIVTSSPFETRQQSSSSSHTNNIESNIDTLT